MAKADSTTHIGLPSARPKSRALRMFDSLANRDFRYLQASNLATQLGQWVQQIGRGWLVYELTASPFQLGLVAFFSGFAMVVSLPFGGFLSDRFDRRRLLVISQVLLMAVAVAMAVLLYTDTIRIWHLYVTALLNGGVSSINNPTRQAMVHDIVGDKDLPAAIALNSVTMNSMRVLGPSLGGVLLSSIGVGGTYVMQAAGFVVAMAATLMIRPTHQVFDNKPASVLSSFTTGFKYARSDLTILMVLVIALFSAMLAWPYLQLMPAYTTSRLGLGETGYGLAMAAVGLGAVTGSLFVAASANRSRKGTILLVSFVLTGVMQVLLGLSSVVALSMLLLLGLGTMTSIHSSLNQTVLQLNVKEEYRGRVLALFYLGFGLQPIGTLPAGAIGERAGVHWAIFALGATMVLVGVCIALTSARVRKL